MNRYIKVSIPLFEMLVGSALTAAAFGMIVIPQGFTAGGVTGLSKIITLLVPLPLSMTVFVINMTLLLLGLIFIGRAFVAKTVALSVLFPAMLELFSRLPLSYFAERPLPAALIAGLMLGSGAGMVLHSGASSGGFDILALILNRKFKISVALVINLCDSAVIVMQAVGLPLSASVYGILVITISSVIVGCIVKLGTYGRPCRSARSILPRIAMKRSYSGQ